MCPWHTGNCTSNETDTFSCNSSHATVDVSFNTVVLRVEIHNVASCIKNYDSIIGFAIAFFTN